jgi:hypothetical protein
VRLQLGSSRRYPAAEQNPSRRLTFGCIRTRSAEPDQGCEGIPSSSLSFIRSIRVCVPKTLSALMREGIA